MTVSAASLAPLPVLTLQNHDRSPSGLVGEVIRETGGEEHVVFPHRGETVPADAARYGGLIVLGGPQFAGDDVAHPYLPAELRAIRAFAAARRPVLGICLGAQLVARAFGATVRRHHTPEIGFTPIEATEAGTAHLLLDGLVPLPPLMQWHYDTFDLPVGARLLATSPVCPHQAFALGEMVIGLQFHLEVTAEILRDWVQEFGPTTPPPVSAFVAGAEAEIETHLPAASRFTRALAQRWMAQVAQVQPLAVPA